MVLRRVQQFHQFFRSAASSPQCLRAFSSNEGLPTYVGYRLPMELDNYERLPHHGKNSYSLQPCATLPRQRSLYGKYKRYPRESCNRKCGIPPQMGVLRNQCRQKIHLEADARHGKQRRQQTSLHRKIPFISSISLFKPQRRNDNLFSRETPSVRARRENRLGVGAEDAARIGGVGLQRTAGESLEVAAGPEGACKTDFANAVVHLRPQAVAT